MKTGQGRGGASGRSGVEGAEQHEDEHVAGACTEAARGCAAAAARPWRHAGAAQSHDTAESRPLSLPPSIRLSFSLREGPQTQSCTCSFPFYHP